MRRLVCYGVLSLSLAACMGSPDAAEDVSNSADDVVVRADGYFTVARDTRRCAAPRCGGFYVTPVNASSARCADGTVAARCYVASLDLGPTALPAAQRNDVLANAAQHVVRGRIDSVRGSEFGQFTVQEAFRSTTGALPSQSLARVSTTGTSCTFLACESLAMQRANSTARPLSIVGVDLAALRVSDLVRDDVLGAATRDEGVLIAGVRSTMPGNPETERVPYLRASQAFLRVAAPNDARHCGAELQASLANATERLLYLSETDAPLTYFTRDAWRALPTDAEIRTAVGAAADAPVERITLERFLRNGTTNEDGFLAEEHRAARFRQLSRTLSRELSNLVVYRVGTIQIRVFALGLTRCGTVAGLETLAVET